MIESAEDLAALFHPDDFGVPMTAHGPDVSTPFIGIPTTASVRDDAAGTPGATLTVPCVIATRASLPRIAQSDEIELPGGQRVVVVDVKTKGDLIVIHYHEHW